VWLTDAVLQLQPFMFTPGSSGFSGMLDTVASGNPGWISHSITWLAAIVDHHPVLTDTPFALVQFVIGFGIVGRRTCKPALALSIAWSVGVWWFGEGAGGAFHGTATPFGGGPGAVLFYALLAVLLWPSEGSDEPFVAARSVGPKAAKIIWVAVWGLLALLSLAGSGRSAPELHGLVTGMGSGQPGWLVAIDRSSATLLLHHGPAMAILLAVVCLIVGLGVFLSPGFTQATLVLAMAVFAVIWVAVENFGGILAGGATDPNSGPLVVLLALVYWPTAPSAAVSSRTAPGTAAPAREL
jgi:hypothetical protein